MTTDNTPMTVEIIPGQALPQAPAIQSAAYNPATQCVVLTFSDGSQIPITGFAEAIASSLGGVSLAVLDANGALMLGGKPRLGVSGAGNLTLPTPLPDSTAGYTPVPGSNEVYSQAGSLGVSQ
ncbi:hypothetical protein AD945_01190 [Gluconobacter albidus]|uniref:Uncharacterized protein n=1 Tax=Gluconobacter albidus TaxID=318683 RepID=A0A149TN45_9PROT|nr:hypothetical protein [Gluconobacter albidus]KXV50821.1 hypothetical protein AD945_01190 [Gluconobacter albidus]